MSDQLPNNLKKNTYDTKIYGRPFEQCCQTFVLAFGFQFAWHILYEMVIQLSGLNCAETDKEYMGALIALLDLFLL